jgi:hypothetical protein
MPQVIFEDLALNWLNYKGRVCQIAGLYTLSSKQLTLTLWRFTIPSLSFIIFRFFV